MLGHANWHTSIPRERLENIRWRKRLLSLCKGNLAYQAAIREACRRDILFYINAFVWQNNPKKKGLEAIGPFCTWPFQERALLDRPQDNPEGRAGILWCYETNNSAVVEKSREMGATWLFLIFEDWLCLFHPYVQCLNISRSADAVDCKSPDSLFWKLRFMHQHLPDWLKGEITEGKMYFGYEQTKSTITGEASTGRAGVGGRAGVIFVDEVSKIKEAREVRERTANTADCRFFNSTHEGIGTEFFKITQTPEFFKIVMHWTEHPEKVPGAYRFDVKKNQIEVLDQSFHFPPSYNFVMAEAPVGGPYPGIRSPWYDKKCGEIGSPRGIAVELDIDVRGSVSQVFNAVTIRLLRELYAQPPWWEGEVRYDVSSGRPVSLVERKDGPVKLWCKLRDGKPPWDSYAGGADVSNGQGATNSCLTILSATTGAKVLEYATPNVYPEHLAPIFTALCWLFADAEGTPTKLCWEHAGPGQTFGKAVTDLGYRRIHYRETKESLLIGTEVSDVPGWFPTVRGKFIVIDAYRAALEGRDFLNRSDIALEECLNYRFKPNGEIEHVAEGKNADPSGARANHGDRVIADALAWKMAQSLGVMRRIGTKPADPMPVLSLAWRRSLAENEVRQDAW